LGALILFGALPAASALAIGREANAAPAATSALRAGAEGVTLEVLVQRVLAVHPALQRAIAESAASESLLDSANWSRFPSISIGASASDSAARAGSWRVQQPVYTFGRTQANIDIARANLEASRANIGVTRRELIERAAVAYNKWLGSLEQTQLAQRNLDRHIELHDFISRRADGGLASQSDIVLAQGRVELARSRLTGLNGQLMQARVEIESLTLQSARGDPIAPAAGPSAPLDPDELSRALVVASPLMQRLKSQVQAASAEAALKEADRFPIVSARFERSPNPISAQYDTRSFLTLDYQSGPGLSVSSDYRARLSFIDALRAELDAQRRELELLGATLASQLETLLSQRPAVEAYAQSASEMVASFIRQFDANRRSWLDVLNAERERFEALLSRAQLLGLLRETTLRIRVAQGELDGLVARR
jgi:adhesin transport system outer membrane protein